MEFVLRCDRDLGENCHDILKFEIREALARLSDFDSDRDLAIHLVRKHNKRIRGFLRLHKTAIEKRMLIQVNKLVRDAAKLFSESRDAFVAVQTLDTLSGEFLGGAREGVRPVRESLEERHLTLRDRKDILADVEQSRVVFAQAERATDAWNWGRITLESILEGWMSNYAKSKSCYETALASRDPEDCHEWRRYAKYMSFHCELLSELAPGIMPGMQASSEELASWLGEHHDLAVFRELMDERGDDASTWLEEQAASRQSELEDLAFDRGAEILVSEPSEAQEKLADDIAERV